MNMDKKYTICISYEMADDLSANSTQQGWVTGLQHFLEKMLSQLFEVELNFLSYTEYTSSLTGNVIEPDIFICILSRRYLQSENCVNDIEQIYNQLLKSNADKKNAASRIIKLIKYPVDMQDQPIAIRYLPGYDLYQPQTSDDQIQEFVNFFAPDIKKELWLKLADLTYDIHEILKTLQSDIELTLDIETVSANTVFLAETGAELLLERHIIKRELEKHGYRVLPEQKLPTDLTGMEAAVRKDLESCSLSIHLIEDSYKELINDTGGSIAGLQHKIAAERCNSYNTSLNSSTQDPAFLRLIWVSPKIKQLNINQISSLRGDARNIKMLSSTEVFQTSLENFKSAIWEELKEVSKNQLGQSRQNARKDYRPEVYLLYDKTDQDMVKSQLSKLRLQEIRLAEPQFDADVLQNREAHLALLRTSDIVILYKHKANEQWLRMKALDIMKSAGYGREKIILYKAILIDQNTDLDTHFFENMGFKVINDPQLYITDLLIQLKDQHRNG
jgi:uncharacterized protein YegL